MATDQKRVRVLRSFYIEKDLIHVNSVLDMRSGEAFAMQAANKVEIVDQHTPLMKAKAEPAAVAAEPAVTLPGRKGGAKDG